MDKRMYELSGITEKAKNCGCNPCCNCGCPEPEPVPVALSDTEVGFDTQAPEDNGKILTMAFVNPQPLNGVYSPDKAMIEGTLFPNINKVFCGGLKND